MAAHYSLPNYNENGAPVEVCWDRPPESGQADCDGWLLPDGTLFVPADGQQEVGTYIQPYEGSPEQDDGSIDDNWLRIDTWLLDMTAGWYEIQSGKQAIILNGNLRVIA